MSEQRINLADLRDGWDGPDPSTFAKVIFALVEAVEAAHAHVQDDPYCSHPHCQRIVNALARFDFGERP